MRRVNFHLLPPHRIVVQFDMRGQRTGTYCLVMQPPDVSLCLQHPGFDIDLRVMADVATLYRVWFGRITFTDALRGGLIELDGTAPLRRDFAGWFALSSFAGTVRAASAGIPVAVGTAPP